MKASNLIRSIVYIIVSIILFAGLTRVLYQPVYYQVDKITEKFLPEEKDFVVTQALSPVLTKRVDFERISSSNLSSSIVGKLQFYSNSKAVTNDPRILAMQQFLENYQSPMAPYADVFVTEADKYGLDWRLVASISGVESAFGHLIPRNSYNGWGWRGGPGGDFSKFSSWADGIRTVTKGLAQGYGTNLTPFQIEPAYCPPCYANPRHAWAHGVTKYMNDLSIYLEEL